MAPRRKKSSTSDIAQDAEMRLDATSGQTPQADVAPEPGQASDAAAPAVSETAPPVSSEATPEPVVATPEPEPTPEPSAPDLRADPAERPGGVEAVDLDPVPAARASRPLAGDRRPAAPRRTSRWVLAGLAAALLVGVAWSGVLAPFMPSGEQSGPGATPPPRLADGTAAPRVNEALTKPILLDPERAKAAEAASQPASASASVANDLRALKEDVARTDAEAAKRLDDLAGRIEAFEKAQVQKLEALDARLKEAEHRIAVGPARPPATAQAPESSPEPAQGQAEAATDPVIASTGSAGPDNGPLPLPRPSDIGSPAASQRPSEQPQQARATVPSSPVRRDWVLRDVYDDVALIEGRWGLIEVVEGSVLPGGGVVQNIRRAGGRWIVTTTSGVIAGR